MTKKTLNQNAKYVQELINTIEPDFVFSTKPINRFKVIENNDDKTWRSLFPRPAYGAWL